MQRSTFEIRRAFRSAFRSGIFTRRRLYDTFEFCNSVWETVTVARIGNSHGTRAMYTIIHRWLNIATPRVTNPTELETVKAPTRSLVALPCIRTGELCPGYDAYSYIFAASYFFQLDIFKNEKRKISTAIRSVGRRTLERYSLECFPTIEQSRLWLRVCVYMRMCIHVCNGLNVWV